MYKQKKDKTSKSEDLDLLYKNLDYISGAYYSAEGIFPFWESVYALIIGQLIVAYFTTNKEWGELIIPCVGIIFSLFWFCVVSLSWEYSKKRAAIMKDLECDIKKRYRPHLHKHSSKKRRIKFYGDITTRKKFSGFFNEIFPTLKNLRNTWYYRRILPLVLFFGWLVLASYNLFSKNLIYYYWIFEMIFEMIVQLYVQYMLDFIVYTT